MFGRRLLTGLALLFFAACQQPIKDEFNATGIVEGTAVRVSAQTGGLLLAVHVSEGEEVDAGQVVAVVDTEKLHYQWQQTQAGLAELSVQTKIASNALAVAQTDFDHIKAKYDRFQDLFNRGSASQQTVDDLENALKQAATRLENARQNVRLIQSKEEGVAAQSKLLRRQIADGRVSAPISGTVTTKYFEPGETVPTGAPVVEIIDLQKMWTKVYVSEQTLPQLTVGQSAEVRADGTSQVLGGTVAWISAKAEFTPKNILTEENRTSLVYAIKVDVDNPDRILKHGMPVAVALHLNTFANR